MYVLTISVHRLERAMSQSPPRDRDTCTAVSHWLFHTDHNQVCSISFLQPTPSKMSRSPTCEEIYSIALSAKAIFASHGWYCCLFGSVACSLFGVTRRPNVRNSMNLAKSLNHIHCVLGRWSLSFEMPTRFRISETRPRWGWFKLLSAPIQESRCRLRSFVVQALHSVPLSFGT